MRFVIPEFFKGLALTAAGSALTLREWLSNGSLFLTLVGAALAVGGGYWAYRNKKLEHQLKVLEVRIKHEELRQLRRYKPD